MASQSPANSGTMTIEEMRAAYPEDPVRKYKDGIARNPPNANQMIQWLQIFERETPSGPPIDPTELLDLDADTLWRIRCLKYRDLPVSLCDGDRVNLLAILDAYRQRKLAVDFDNVTVWYAGHMVYGLVPNKSFNFARILREKCPECYEKYGESAMHAEQPGVINYL
ncbi:hypothetical protein MGYG_06377 [Nannizzia gypsea CBS 118893]|uniref:Uncharacterized protein n=1 Tax=Arthroderma gypseum (strain ATCC MYA-4604 / CBS 118893) TaxID=535722 RepID=E4UZ48_ARTGP|nr:hypothetical protein MGYG_06377 [Nannizzia gypsea CBS 118893]EFR03378.1 hypothetical protein MGYG_06377 [Nannizzia gypsea CBS 118893]